MWWANIVNYSIRTNIRPPPPGEKRGKIRGGLGFSGFIVNFATNMDGKRNNFNHHHYPVSPR